MEEITTSTILIESAANNKLIADLSCIKKTDKNQPVAIFAHGFMGFKDWGAFNIMAHYFASNGLALLKFNFSGNGTSIEQPNVFSEPEKFGKNTYSQELIDLGEVIDWIETNAKTYHLDAKEIYLIGHSRGGTMAIIKAMEESRIKKVVAWCPFYDIKARFRQESIAVWNNNETWYVENKRTGDKLPLYKTFYQDFLINQHRFNLDEVSAHFEKPLLLLHAKDDEAVSIEDSRKFYNNISHAIKIEFDGGGHTFGINHPWEQHKIVPEVFNQLLENTLYFLIDEE